MTDSDVPIAFDFVDISAWEDWLTIHAQESRGVWLRIGKAHKNTGLIGIGDAGDAALCFGWIDSQRRSFDGVSFLQRYSPRRVGSPWSLVNARRAETLTVAGRMRPGGRREIDAARVDGRWDAAYEPQRDAAVPEDFAAALAENPAARQVFEPLGKTARYAMVLPILKASDAAVRKTLGWNAGTTTARQRDRFHVLRDSRRRSVDRSSLSGNPRAVSDGSRRPSGDSVSRSRGSRRLSGLSCRRSRGCQRRSRDSRGLSRESPRRS